MTGARQQRKPVVPELSYLGVSHPGFGGYDLGAIARGASVPGHPLTWAVTGERLHF